MLCRCHVTRQAPVWINPPLVVFHGTDLESAHAILLPANGNEHAIDFKSCRPDVDFGRGFYVTTVERQAKDWANIRIEKRTPGRTAAVLKFLILRDDLARCDDLVFSNPSGDAAYWAFIRHCRMEMTPMHGRMTPYDIVIGPVSLWPQRQLMRDCDQIAFHTERSLAILQRPTILTPKGASMFREELP
jgi:hypothetical protein